MFAEIDPLTLTDVEAVQDSIAAAPVRRAGSTDGAEAMVRKIGSRDGQPHCPACGSIVYSRRHRLCGVCSQPLPEEFLFTAEQTRYIETLLETERQRHRAWLLNSFRKVG